jgi:hypothetical protein
MARVNVRGQEFNIPDQINGRDLRQALNTRPDEIPVRVNREGDFEPINNDNEYRIQDENQFDKIHRLENG